MWQLLAFFDAYEKTKECSIVRNDHNITVVLFGYVIIFIVMNMKANGSAESEKLAEMLGVSTMTIHRDFAKLRDEGLESCVYGGALWNDLDRFEMPMTNKITLNID